MKRLPQIINIIAIVVVMLFVSAVSGYTVKDNTAEVDQEQGLYIFVRSKPVKEYEFLGKVNMPEIASGKSAQMMATAVRRARKQYPEATAIIIQSENFAKVDAIRLK